MKFFFTATVLLMIGGKLAGQTTLKFCVEVGKEGTCKTQTSEFAIGKDGGTISFLLKSPSPLGFSNVDYKIYKLQDNGDEVYNSTITQKLDSAWTYAWEEAVFYDEGTYKVKVYPGGNSETLLCTNILKLFRQ